MLPKYEVIADNEVITFYTEVRKGHFKSYIKIHTNPSIFMPYKIEAKVNKLNGILKYAKPFDVNTENQRF